MPVNGREGVRATRRHQGLREAQAVGDGDVVVRAKPWISISGRSSFGASCTMPFR